MSALKPTVFIVDDDAAIRTTISQLVASMNLKAETFSTANEFLDSYDPARPGCLILDIRMPGISGMALQSKLLEEGSFIPIIFITGHGDVPMAAEAMRTGAVDFIEKPFRNQALLDRIYEALAKDAHARKTQTAQDAVDSRLNLLSPREREVLTYVRAGKRNNVIAQELGVSQRTVEVHRSNIMKKLKVGSVAELVAMIGTTEVMQ